MSTKQKPRVWLGWVARCQDGTYLPMRFNGTAPAVFDTRNKVLAVYATPVRVEIREVLTPRRKR